MNGSIEEMNVTQYVYIKKYFLKASSIDKPTSYGVNKVSLVPSTCLTLTWIDKSNVIETFKEGPKVALIQSCKGYIGQEIRRFYQD